VLRRIVLLACVGLAALSGGCGTLLNTTYFTPDEGGERVYGGVRLDAEVIEDGYGQRSPLVIALFLADLPFTLIGDTVSLPYTVALAMRGAKPADAKGTGPSESATLGIPGGAVQQAGAKQPATTAPAERLNGEIGP
jgi:uncharacterized protein YceK